MKTEPLKKPAKCDSIPNLNLSSQQMGRAHLPLLDPTLTVNDYIAIVDIELGR